MPHPSEHALQAFEKTSLIKTTLPAIIAFHEDARALSRLTPPPVFVQIQRDARQSLTQGEVDFTLWFGLLPVRWTARHEPGSSEHSFIDRQVRGPMDYWEHEHSFKPREGGVELRDHLRYRHGTGLWGLFTRVAFCRTLLHLLFSYRHLRTRLALR